MKNKVIKISLGIALILLLASETVYSFMNTDLSEQTTGESIQIAHIPWDTESASSNVLGLVLEEAGYNVTLIAVDEAILYESMASGESDVTTSAWLPVTHGQLYAEYEDDIVDLGENLTGAVTSLVVPSYMAVDSIDDLENEANQTITGIEPGSGIMTLTEELMATYDNLNDWELEASSTGAMLGLLDSAIQEQEEIVLTGWSPHWMFHEYDLKLLDEPAEVYGGTESIYTMARTGFEEDYPEASQIAENFEWTVEDMDNVTYQMENGVDDRTAAQNWIDDNQERVDSWLEGVFE